MCPQVLKGPKYAGSNRVKCLLCQFPFYPLSAAFQLPQAVVPQDKHGVYGLVFFKTRNFQFPDISKSKVLIARIHLFQISAICSLPAPSSLGAAVLIPTVTVIAATFQSGSRSCLLTSNNFFETWLYENLLTMWSPKGKKGWGVGSQPLWYQIYLVTIYTSFFSSFCFQWEQSHCE